MKLLPVFLILALFSVNSHGIQSIELPESNVVATVDGVSILKTELSRSLEMTEFILGAAEFKKAREQLEKSLLEDEIDRRLLRQEFKRRGGAIKPMYVEEMVSRFVADRFKGNEAAFRDELSSIGLTEEDLKTRLTDDLLPHVFQSDRLNGGDFELWLQSLRDKSEIEIAE